MTANPLKRTKSSRYIEIAFEYLRQSMSRSLFSAIIIAAVVGFVSFAYAQEDGVKNEKNTNGFFPAHTKWFEEGDATTVFSKDPEKTDSPEVGFYKEKEEKIEEPEVEEVANTSAPAKAAKPPFDTKKATPEQIKAFYGDPKEEPPLKPEDNAPASFKGMGAALDSGNEKLAFEYARQYVRYLSGTANRVSTVTKLTDLAFEREGIRPSVEKNNPYQYLLNQDLMDSEEADSDKRDPKDKKLSSLISQAAQAEGIDLKRLNTVPTDSKGEVDVLFFFNPTDVSSLKMAYEVQKLQSHVDSDETVKITGFSLSSESKEVLSHFAQERGFSYAIQPGISVGANLAVQKSPTVIFIARNSQKMFRLEDFHTGAELNKIILHMKGGPHA